MKTLLLSIYLLVGLFSYGQFHLGEYHKDTYNYFKSNGDNVSYQSTSDGSFFIEVTNSVAISGFYIYNDIIVSAIIIPHSYSKELACIASFNEDYLQISSGIWSFTTLGYSYYIRKQYSASLNKNVFFIDQ